MSWKEVHKPFDGYYNKVKSLLNEKLNEGKADQRGFLSESIALLPLEIIKYLISEDVPIFDENNESLVAVCVNYYSPTYPDDRFFYEDIKTFCPKYIPNDTYMRDSLGDCIKLYEKNHAFVKLLDLFFTPSAIENKAKFTMKSFLKEKGPEEGKSYYSIKASEYLKNDVIECYDESFGSVVSYLEENFTIPETSLNYDEYARYLIAASGNNVDYKEDPKYVKWNKNNKNDWKKKMGNKSYVQDIIPIYSLEGEIVANVLIFSLTEGGDLLLNSTHLNHISKECGRCLRLLWEYEQSRRLEQSLIKSAIASVMARNQSHNLGSHVLNVMSSPDYIAKLTDAFLKDYESAEKGDELSIFNPPNYLGTIYGSPDGNGEKIINIRKGGNIDKSKIFESVISPQIAIFNSYIKHRMEYVSDLSFSAPPLLVTRRLKNDILFELNQVGLLLNNISGRGEEFKYKIRVINNISGNNDLGIDVPNDIIGTQAFYNIIENFIRNTAKHFKAETGDKACEHEIRIEFDDFSKDLYRVKIYHNHKEDKPQEVEKKINEWIDKEIHVNGRVRSEGLGIIEMKAAAAYLRKEDISYVNRKVEDVQPPLIKVILTKEQYLGYEFYMLKPKTILIVTSGKPESINDEEGVQRISMADFQSSLNKGAVYDHIFLVKDIHEKDQPGWDDIIITYKTHLPLRILNGISDPDVSIDKCWRRWGEMNKELWEMEFSGKKVRYFDHLEERERKIPESEFKACSYAEALSSNAANKLPPIVQGTSSVNIGSYMSKLNICQNKPGHVEKTWIYSSFVKNNEAVNTRIAVIDERIQKESDTEAYGVPLGIHYEKAQIIIPKKDDINLNAENYAETGKKILEWIDNQINIDFFVIHYGIMERIFKSVSTSNEGWKESLDSFLRSLAGKSNVVIESGRGVPSDLPDCVRFISLSSLVYSMIECRSKYYLTNLLYSSKASTIS